MTTTQKSFPDAIILDVDLTNKNISKRELSGDLYKLYPGGSALGVYLMLQELKPNIDPFSPDNLLTVLLVFKGALASYATTSAATLCPFEPTNVSYVRNGVPLRGKNVGQYNFSYTRAMR